MLVLSTHFKYITTKMQALPDKLNFKIGETSKILDVAPHVLRYWEKEFSSLKTEKYLSQHRMYTKKNIQILLLIKCLLYKEKFSIEGLRKHLAFYCKELQKYQGNTAGYFDSSVKKNVHQLLESISHLRNAVNKNI